MITQSYCLLPVDLRQPAALQAVLEQAKLQPNLPTYIIAECVLVYMRPEESNAAVRWLGSYFQQAAFVIYEQVTTTIVLFSGQCAEFASVTMAADT